MQTFLPYPDYMLSAQALDNKRLGKQRVEAWQILDALLNNKWGWRSHPAVKMWRGAEYGLCNYGIAVCKEWQLRGFKDTMLNRFLSVKSACYGATQPSWFRDERFHASHRSNLLRKYPAWYGRYNWRESTDLPYVWPTEN